MVHRNAPLTETGRLRLAQCVVEDGWPLRRAAERFQVSHVTAARWAGRYRQLGAAGMADRSSRPHASPTRTARRTERRIVKLRFTARLGPARIGYRLGVAPSTVHAVLRRYGCARLAFLDRATGLPVRRYERSRPGELVHVDVKKLGRIPDGGGWRVTGKATGNRNRHATSPHQHPRLGYDYLHTVIDDCSRLAYTEILTDEKQETAASFLARAHAWFTAAGITIEQILSGNGPCYRSKLWAATCQDLGITAKRTRPFRPQTNGKVERYHRTLTQEWAYHRPYASQAERCQALDPWLHTYNHHRGHTALGGLPPASRVTNLTGQYS